MGKARSFFPITTQNPGITDVYVANLGAEMAVPAFTFTQSLRQKGVKADCDVCGRSLKAQFKFADKVNAKLVAILGGDEYARGTVKIRNMETREETELPLETAAEQVAQLLK